MLFDLPRRSLLGWFALYEHQAGFLRELMDHMAPEEIGRRMKTPGTRPYHLQLFIIMCSHFLARQQRMLDLGLSEGDPFPEERHDDLVTVPSKRCVAVTCSACPPCLSAPPRRTHQARGR